MNADAGHNGFHDPRGALLTCRTEIVSDCSVIHVSGEVDVATIHIFKEALDAAVAAPYTIIVDFAATAYIDSTGIHELIRAKERHRHPLAVAALAPTLKKIFQITKIDEVIALYATLDAALSAVCTRSASGHVRLGQT
jgi:anti-sigma B factor antagonist